ncbi:MAG TPA: PRC-barrel domain-containing protein [Casimicrobiaceae bacterium]|nr:PRC-barrel domain-containing protein [Casimicrobiaceae bacterium]
MKLQRKSSYLMLIPALALTFSVSGHAAGDVDKRVATTSAATNAAPDAKVRTAGTTADKVHQMRVSELIGKNVTNAKGEGVGEIKDLVIDTTSGKVQYAVLSFGGFLGMGDKLFAYPLEKFERMSERGKLVLNVDKEKMKSAPGFDDKSWPNFSTATYRGEVDKFYGSKSAQGNVRFARATQILKGDVKDRAKKDIGDIEDVVVSLPTGQVSYVVLEFDRAWNPNDKLVAMPMKALKSEDGDGTDLVYQANRETLEGVPSFDKNRWPDLDDTKWRSDVTRYEQNWRAAPVARTGTPERAAERVERSTERAADKVDRATDRVTAPAKQ